MFVVRDVFTSAVTIRMLRSLAKLRLRIVVKTSPIPNYSYGWLNAKSPIPKKRKTRVSAD